MHHLYLYGADTRKEKEQQTNKQDLFSFHGRSISSTTATVPILLFEVRCTSYLVFLFRFIFQTGYVSFASDYYQTFPRCDLSPANTSRGAINLFPTTHMLQKNERMPKGTVWKYIKQQRKIDRINLLLYIHLKRQIEVIA